MRKSVLVLVLLVALTGGCGFFASQLPDDNDLVAEMDFENAIGTEEMPEDARAALYNAWNQIEIDNPQISFSFRDNGGTGSPFDFRFYVLYNGLRIQGAFLVVRPNRRGDVTRVSLSDIGNISLDTMPTISQAEAEAIAMTELGDNNLTFFEVELVIRSPRSDYNTSRLIWDLSSAGGFAGVDAHSGEFLGFESRFIF